MWILPSSARPVFCTRSGVQGVSGGPGGAEEDVREQVQGSSHRHHPGRRSPVRTKPAAPRGSSAAPENSDPPSMTPLIQQGFPTSNCKWSYQAFLEIINGNHFKMIDSTLNWIMTLINDFFVWVCLIFDDVCIIDSVIYLFEAALKQSELYKALIKGAWHDIFNLMSMEGFSE